MVNVGKYTYHTWMVCVIFPSCMELNNNLMKHMSHGSTVDGRIPAPPDMYEKHAGILPSTVLWVLNVNISTESASFTPEFQLGLLISERH